MRVALGGKVDGWLVSDIRPRAVVLTLGDRHVIVTLSEVVVPSAPTFPQL